MNLRDVPVQTKAMLVLVALFVSGTVRAEITIGANLGVELKLGAGFDSINAQPCRSPIGPNLEGRTEDDEVGRKIESRAEEVRSATAFKRQLSVNVSGAYYWLTGSVDGNYSQLFSAAGASESYRRLFSVDVITLRKEIKESGKVLDGEALALLNHPADFIRKYGDHYVRAVRMGGTFLAGTTLTSDHYATRDEIAARIGASWAGGELDASASGLGEASRSYFAATTKISINGGLVNILPKINELDQRAGEFSQAVAATGAANVIQYILSPIEQLSGFQEMATPKTKLYFRKRSDCAKQMTDTLLFIDDLLADIALLKEVSANRVSGRNLAGVGRQLAASEERAQAERQRVRGYFDKLLSEGELPSESVLTSLDVEVVKKKIAAGVIRKAFVRSEELTFNVPITYRDGAGGAEHGQGQNGRGTSRCSWRLEIKDGAVKFDADEVWDRNEQPDYHAVFRMKEPHEIARLPRADYYFLPNGMEMDSDFFEATTLLQQRLEFGPNRLLLSAVRIGFPYDIRFEVKPFRVLGLVLLD